MKAVVVDTNVLVVANDAAPGVSEDCAFASIIALEEARSGLVVLDDAGRIFDEYRRKVNPRGGPGVGDSFFKWLWDNQADPSQCELVSLRQRGIDEDDFKEFPDDPALAGFDRSDRKFVAVARASRNNPDVLNAVDTDWWTFREPLMRHGVRVKFLCPDRMLPPPRAVKRSGRTRRRA